LEPYGSFISCFILIVCPTKKVITGCTWLFLIIGGEKSFAEEKVARDELKKIYKCFVSKKLVKPEHVVCANCNGGKEKLFQHETIVNVSKVSSVVPQPLIQSCKTAKTRNKQGLNLVHMI